MTDPRDSPDTAVPPVADGRAARRDATENRAALLEAARIVLNRDPESTLETIAAEAKLSRRAVYGHFASRDDLLRTLASDGARRITAATDDIAHDDPVVRLALLAARIWREVQSVRVMAVIALRGPLRGVTADALRPLRARVHSAVRDGVESGGLRRDIPSERLARLIESAAITVLDESVHTPLEAAEGHRLVMLVVLGAAGLSWQEAADLIDGTPELAWEA